MKTYKEFINENVNDDLWKNEMLLKNVAGLTIEELDNASKYGIRTAEQIYSLMTMKNQSVRDGIKKTLGVDEERFNKIKEIIKANLNPVIVEYIENYVPVEYSMGALEPKKD